MYLYDVILDVTCSNLIEELWKEITSRVQRER